MPLILVLVKTDDVNQGIVIMMMKFVTLFLENVSKFCVSADHPYKSK